MEVAVVVLAALLVALAAARRWWSQDHRGGSPDPAEAGPEASDAGAAVTTLSPGAHVRYRDERLLVERSLHYTMDAERWREHRLSDDRVGRSLWLEVQEQAGLVLTVYERLPVGETPPEDEEIHRDGIRYALAESGRAEYRSHERAGPGKHGTMEYVEFAAGRVRLAYERFDGGPWEVSLGHVVEPDDIEVSPD